MTPVLPDGATIEARKNARQCIACGFQFHISEWSGFFPDFCPSCQPHFKPPKRRRFDWRQERAAGLSNLDRLMAEPPDRREDDR
jgi:hypothetical protein